MSWSINAPLIDIISVEAEADVVLLEGLASPIRLSPRLYERSRISRLRVGRASPTRLRDS